MVGCVYLLTPQFSNYSKLQYFAMSDSGVNILQIAGALAPEEFL